jgi:hypothetical protein
MQNEAVSLNVRARVYHGSIVSMGHDTLLTSTGV